MTLRELRHSLEGRNPEDFKNFYVHFFARSKEMNKQKIFKVFFRTLSFAAKKGYPQESRPLAFRVPTKVGIPSPGTFSRGRYELAHLGARTT
jgi:hypothetical protein